jgi:ferritin-like metal-binding protein YciE
VKLNPRFQPDINSVLRAGIRYRIAPLKLAGDASFRGHAALSAIPPGERESMAIKNENELFVFLLSDLRQSAQRATNIFREIARAAPDSDVREAFHVRVSVSAKIIATLDEAFNLIGEAPLKVSAPLQDDFLEPFRQQLAGIESFTARRLFILVKTNHVIHRRIGEYAALIALADVTSNHGVRALLESCLADNIAFADTTRRLMLEPAHPERVPALVPPIARAAGHGPSGV